MGNEKDLTISSEKKGSDPFICDYHFVGVGGVGMSGLAKLLLKNGAKVAGSDMCKSSITDSLVSMGAEIFIGHNADNISESAEVVVVSAAVKEDNPELVEAKKRNLKIYKYAQFLGVVMDCFKGIAVCGTHGKSTTSGWLSYVMSEAGASPSWIVGADVIQLGDSNGAGEGEYFIAEACEYDRSFLNLRPMINVILNIEQDHLDYYKDEAEIIEAFGEFAGNVREGGVIVANGMDINVCRCLQAFRSQKSEVRNQKDGVRIDRFGFSDEFEIHPANITEKSGLSEFDVIYRGENIGRAEVSLPGHHNILNCLAVVGAAMAAGMEKSKIFENLSKFSGMDRRLMLKDEVGGITIMDDYAHHPTEIRAALRAVRDRYRCERVICVFEPHQYSRTRFLLDDFAQSFKLADITVVPEIYFVRDTEQMKQEVNAEMLVERINGRGSKAIFISDFDGIVEYLKRNAAKGDLVITMGAGNIWKVADGYIQWLRRNS